MKQLIAIFGLVLASAVAIEACKPSKVGCFTHNDKYDDILFSDRKEHEGKRFHSKGKIDFGNFKAYFEKALCRCDQAAAEKGYSHYAIREYGECHGIREFQRAKHKPSIYCLHHSYIQCAMHHIKCFGADEGQYIYKTTVDIKAQRRRWYKNLAGKQIALLSHHNRYVVSESNGHANANRPHRSTWETWKVELLGNFKIALRSYFNKYLVAESNGQANANRDARGPWEIFTIEFLSKDKIALKSHHNRYLVAEANGHLNANRPHRGPWEIFTLKDLGRDPDIRRYQNLANKQIALKSAHNRYVVSESNGHANANRPHRSTWETWKVELLGNFKIALRSYFNKYLVAESNGQANANHDHRGAWEIFTIEFLSDNKVALKSHHNRYLVAEANGHLNANRPHRAPWEIFTLEDLGRDPDIHRYKNLAGKRIALKSAHNRYVVAEANGAANANRPHRGAWEIWRVELLGNRKIALKSHHNRYLVAEGNGGANANRPHRGAWEIFTIEFLSDNKVALKSHHNRYLVAEANGHLNANRPHRAPWEIFTLEIV